MKSLNLKFSGKQEKIKELDKDLKKKEEIKIPLNQLIKPFNYNKKEANYEIDTLQDAMLQMYLRADRRFRRAFFTDYTAKFLKYLEDKTRLREPIHLSVLGQVRTFTQNNYIFTEKGWKKPSQLNDCKSVLSYNFDLEKYELKPFELVKKEYNPKEKFYKITFSDGREIEIGENHPIFTSKKGWKKAFSLYLKIDIPFFSNYPNIIPQKTISKELARICAFLLSCGHLNNSSCNFLDKRDNRIYKKVNHTISYCSSSKEMINQLCKDFYKEFKIKLRKKKKRNNRYKGIEVEIGNKEIFNFLSNFIPIGKKAGIIRIPKEIFNSSTEIHREFLSILFSGDSYFSKKEAMIEYCSTSKEFVKDIQLLLSQYGIISYIHQKERKNPNHNTLYRLYITNKQNILNFLRFIKKLIHIQKYQNLKKMCKNLNKIVKFLKPRKFFINKITEIKPLDKLIYDIFVQDNNNFFLNGILTHNSGKSYMSLALACFVNALYGRKMNINYITANAYEFIEKLKDMPMDKVKNSCFLIDEEKQSVWGIGSIAKKIKLTDVQNIIAIQNISTIMLNPVSWANREANYGIRTFGRCFKTKTVRCMLYNLTEKGSGAELPMGVLHLPIFTEIFIDAKTLEEQYLAKKNTWVEAEQRGEGDVLYEIKMNSARSFCKDKIFLSIKAKKERLTYIATRLGSEWTKSECQEILSMTNLLLAGQLK